MTLSKTYIFAISVWAALMLITGCTDYPPSNAPDCSIDRGPCIKAARDGATEVTFEISPRPVRSMAELRFSVGLVRDGWPVDDAALVLDLTMPGMYMGDNRIRLLRSGSGIYTGGGVLPRCPSGGRIWRVELLRLSTDPALEPVSLADFTFEVRER